MGYLIGIDIGGTKCAVILGRQAPDGSGIGILDRLAFATEVQNGPRYALDKLVQSVEDILRKSEIPMEALEGVGVSCGGPLDSRWGVILSPPNLVGWDNIPIVALLEERFGVRTRLQNDANACALAEWLFGAARGTRNTVFLTFGTGMGAGLILDGRLYSGTNDMAGEVGHMRLSKFGPVGYGKAGSFEGFCSGGGIAQLARTMALEKLQMGEKVGFCDGLGALDAVTAKSVGDAAEAGDPLAREVYRTSGQYLGRGLSVLIDILNPEIIVIGSIFTRSRELLYNAMMESVEKEALSYARNVCKIVPAGLGEKIGDYAALAVAGYHT